MAKKKLSNKELKRQRQQEKGRIRSEKDWEPPESADLYPEVDPELVEDIRPLMGSTPTPTQNELQMMMESLLESAELIDEPEFEDVLLDPMASVTLFIDAAHDRGFTPEDVGKLDEDERIMFELEIIADITDELLTPESLQEIVEALEELRARLKRQGKPLQVAQVALVQSFLQYPEDANALEPIGLVQALVMKSVTAGFEMGEASLEILKSLGEESAEEQQRGGIRALAERLNRSGLVEKVADKIDKVPGLGSFMRKKADDTWATGLSRLFTGELFLGLYDDEELSGAVAIFKRIVTDALQAGEVVETKGPEVMEQLIQYVSELMTPERFDQLHADVRSLLRDEPDLSPKEKYFLTLADVYLAEEDAVQNEIAFLTNALMGELKQYVMAASLEEE
jgi:hypothetical protein